MNQLFEVLKLTVFFKIKNASIATKRNLMAHNINHIMSKKVMDRYMRLEIPCNKVLATYFWIDGSGIHLRTKDRILNCVPLSAESAPDWAFDGSSTGLASTANSDTKLIPIAVYKDPFRMEPHVIIANEVYLGDGKAAPTNHRKFCNDLCETHKEQEPWFGLEQQYTMLDVDDWGLGWPKGGGFPAVKYEYSYCGVGAKYVTGRDVCESHERACLYSCLDFEGTNSEVMFSSWEFRIGVSMGIQAADEMWTARYILERVAENYGVQITYHPVPFGKLHPAVRMHHNLSNKSMRTAPGGYLFIDKMVGKLEKNHVKHMNRYGNEMRKAFEIRATPYQNFTSAIADRKADVRLPETIKEIDSGYIEDRRPAPDTDPYIVCGLLLETCFGSAKTGEQNKSSPSCPSCPCSPCSPCGPYSPCCPSWCWY